MHNSDVIIRPIITEASMKAAEKGKFSFQVDLHATKPIIRQAVESAFGVHVIGVATVTRRSKSRRVGRARKKVLGSLWKKAVVALKKGEKIGLFGMGKEE